MKWNTLRLSQDYRQLLKRDKDKRSVVSLLITLLLCVTLQKVTHRPHPTTCPTVHYRANYQDVSSLVGTVSILLLFYL